MKKQMVKVLVINELSRKTYTNLFERKIDAERFVEIMNEVEGARAILNKWLWETVIED